MRAILAGLLVACAVAPARGELAPSEVAIVVMDTSRESRQLAEYYAKARSIPPSNIFRLIGKPQEAMPRIEWEGQARPALRNWLLADGRETKIRCVVTVGDVPLKIGPRDPHLLEFGERRAFLERARQVRVQQFAAVLKLLRSLMGRASEKAEPAAEAKYAELASAFESLVKEVEVWRRNLSPDQRKSFDAKFERTFLAVGGMNAMLKAARRAESAKLPDNTVRQLDQSTGKMQGLEQGLQALASLPESVARDAQILGLLQQIGGLLGSIQWIDDQLGLLAKNETYASFDSELAMLHWPDYPLLRWQPNALYYRFDAVANKRPTLMVARLSAASNDIVMRIIDAGIATEKTGLQGTVYLDTRGITSGPRLPQPGTPGQYDQSLRNLAERLKGRNNLKVVLNDKPELFQPGECPDAALYCGWYSLGKYVDAFDWRPGAIGYHIASMEAQTLRNPNSQVWCNAMLRDGICATLGPTHEPYLTAFPLPDEFFSLLLTGRYTLAEAYYRTLPFNSWVMVLVGDPLYNPFKNHPVLREDELPESLRPKPPAPGADQDLPHTAGIRDQGSGIRSKG